MKLAHNHISSLNKKREKQTRYLSQAIQLEEAVNPHIINDTLSMVSLSILIFLLWAGFTNIHEVARSPGEVVPHQFIQKLQHLEGGMIKQIHVREGEVVTKGQVLISMDGAPLREDIQRVETTDTSLQLHLERLRAFIENRKPDFTHIAHITPEMITEQTAIFEGMLVARRQESQIIQNQIIEKGQAILTIENDLAIAHDNYQIREEINHKRIELNKKGFLSDLAMLEEKQRLNEIKATIKRLENQRIIAKQEVEQFNNRLKSLKAQHNDQAYEKIAEITAEKAQNAKILDKLLERLDRLSVRSPSDGLVKGITVSTIGEVVQPGKTLMEIVPIGNQLEVVVKISPRDIGHVTVGQDVQVKFSSYDFSRYGSVPGKLSYISASTFMDNDNQRYYEGKITLTQGYVGHNKNNIILPGMTAIADIITGNKTVLQYMLKPIHLYVKTAFTER